MNTFFTTLIISLIFSITAHALKSKTVAAIKIDNYTITTERAQTGYDEVVVKKASKVISKLKLERMDAAPEVLKLEKVKNAPQYIFIDYYKGSSGTQNMKDCYDALLFKLEKNGAIKLEQKLEYKCNVVSADQSASAESFIKKYQIVVKNGKPQIIE